MVENSADRSFAEPRLIRKTFQKSSPRSTYTVTAFLGFIGLFNISLLSCTPEVQLSFYLWIVEAPSLRVLPSLQVNRTVRQVGHVYLLAYLYRSILLEKLYSRLGLILRTSYPGSTHCWRYNTHSSIMREMGVCVVSISLIYIEAVEPRGLGVPGTSPRPGKAAPGSVSGLSCEIP